LKPTPKEKPPPAESGNIYQQIMDRVLAIRDDVDGNNNNNDEEWDDKKE